MLCLVKHLTNGSNWANKLSYNVSHAFSLHHSVSFLMVNIVMIVMMINGVGNVAGDDGDGDNILKWNS